VDPSWCMPVTIDVGTDNQELLKDPLYTGLKHKRIRDHTYDELIQEFIDAAKQKYGPYTLLQFEDFGNSNAFRLLEIHKDRCCTFNDDIQGTASVVLAGIVAALPLSGRQLRDHTFVFLGAGSAGVGIANLIAFARSVEEKIPMEEARKNIWLVDSQGLVVKSRGFNNNVEKGPFAHEHKELKNLIDVVTELKATALIGVCAIPQTFDERVCVQMAANTSRPIIFALSNPTSKAECTAEQAYKWTKGQAIFASGSPFDPVTLDGKTFVPGQGNNSYIFPGLAMGILLTGAQRVTQNMFYVAAKTLAGQVTQQDLDKGTVYPPLKDIHKVSAHIAASVGHESYMSKLATYLPEPDDLFKFVANSMYSTDYGSFA